MTSVRTTCDALTAAIEVALAGHGTAHWLALLEKLGVPCAPINDIAAIANDPHIAARNMIVGIEDPEAGPAEAGRQSDQDVGLRRPHDAGRGTRHRPRPRAHPPGFRHRRGAGQAMKWLRRILGALLGIVILAALVIAGVVFLWMPTSLPQTTGEITVARPCGAGADPARLPTASSPSARRMKPTPPSPSATSMRRTGWCRWR